MSNRVLKIDRVSITLHGGELVKLSTSVRGGEILTVMGPSGVGKSTLLAFLAGFLPQVFEATGQVWLGSTELTQLPAEQRRLGLLFQDPLLFPHLSVAENLCFGMPAKNIHNNELAVSSLSEMGLEKFADRDPATLSGGQKARVALLRTLLSQPEAILLDEPFNKLDASLRCEIRSLVFERIINANLPAILVTHDKEDAKAAGGTVIVLE